MEWSLSLKWIYILGYRPSRPHCLIPGTSTRTFCRTPWESVRVRTTKNGLPVLWLTDPGVLPQTWRWWADMFTFTDLQLNLIHANSWYCQEHLFWWPKQKRELQAEDVVQTHASFSVLLVFFINITPGLYLHLYCYTYIYILNSLSRCFFDAPQSGWGWVSNTDSMMRTFISPLGHKCPLNLIPHSGLI